MSDLYSVDMMSSLRDYSPVTAKKNNNEFEKYLFIEHEEDGGDGKKYDFSRKGALSSDGLLNYDDMEKLIESPSVSKVKSDAANINEKIELHEQKKYAIGKLSYIEREVSSNISMPSSSIDKAVKNYSKNFNELNIHKNDNTSVELKNNNENKISFHYGTEIVSNNKLKNEYVARLVVNNEKYDRQKITKTNNEGKERVYIRNYFDSIEEIGEIISIYVDKLKGKVKLIVNGKER